MTTTRVTSYSLEEFHQLLIQNNMTREQAALLEHSQPFDKSRAWLFIAYSTLLLIGLAGNAWVTCIIVCVLRTARRSRSTSSTTGSASSSSTIQIFILALCCCDLVVLFFLIFLLLDLAYGRWVVPSTAVCQLYLCSESLNKFCGPFILTSMSGYCYSAVCWPGRTPAVTTSTTSATMTNLTCSKRRSSPLLASESSKAVAMVLACLASVLVLMSPVYIYGGIHYLLVIQNRTIVKNVLPKCSIQPPEGILMAFTTYSFVLGYLVPALLFTYFYSAILYRARKRPLSSAGGNEHQHNHYFWRVAKTCMALVSFYLLCWTPYWCMSIWHFVAPLIDPTSRQQNGVVVSYLLHMLPYINCTGYPILYTLINRSIKAAYTQAREERKKRKRDRRMVKISTQSRSGITYSSGQSLGVELPSANSSSFAQNQTSSFDDDNGNATRTIVFLDEETAL